MKKIGAIAYDERTKKSNRLVGVVRVITGTETAKLVFQTYMNKKTEKETTPLFKNGTPELRVDLADLPKFPKILPNDKTGKLYRVRMSADGDEVENLGPVNTSVTGIIVDVSREGGADGTPYSYEKENDFDPDKPLKEFWISYKVTDGHFKNVVLPAYRLRDIFEENPDELGSVKFTGNPNNPKATQIRRTVEWGQLYNVWDEPIQWPSDGNVIPEIFDRAMADNKPVNIEINSAGYPSEIRIKESYADYDEPEPKATKLEKKVVAKKSAPARTASKNGHRSKRDEL